jgi:beta-glucosidase
MILPRCGQARAFLLPLLILGLAVAPAWAAERTVVDARVDALLRRMNLDEKAGQLNQLFLNLTTESVDGGVRAGAYGSMLYAADTGYIAYLQHVAVEQSRLGIPLIFGLDVINGYRTIFPPPLAMAASWDPALVESTRAIAAREASAAGISWTFAPMVDIARDPRWGRIVEGAGEDPYLGAAMAAAQVRGLQGPAIGTPGRMLATAKHFAGYGAPRGGRDYEDAALPESDLWNVYLPPFKAAIDAGVGSVMSAYMNLNDVPATGNRWLMRDVLRDALGFRGLVVSDAFAIRSLITHGFARDEADAALRAVAAGINVDMDGRIYPTQLPALVKSGRLTERQVDDLVRPLLAAKVDLGLFERPYPDESTLDAVLDAPEHRVAARIAAERAAVLLRNESGFLPLRRERVKTVAVIGPLAASAQDTLGPWTTTADRSETVTVLDGLRAKLGPAVRVDYAQGVQIARKFPSEFDQFYHLDPEKPWPPERAAAERQRAVKLAREADVTVAVLGEAYNMSGENASRASLALPGDQLGLLQALVAAGAKVAVVLINGRPLDIAWAADKVPAILEAWYPGTQGGHAVANLLFGDAVPGGKLPVTWPRTVGQIPLFYAHNLTMSPGLADRRTWDEASTPLFPFGHGLSYTRFAYDGLRLDRPAVNRGGSVGISVDVTNAGTVGGDEVVQLYVHQRYGSASRPVRELKGFRRLALAPGARATVTFALGPEELSFWSGAERKRVQDAAEFDVWVGGDSNAVLHDTFTVQP